MSPPSHCPRCNHRLAWRDNIPVLGWMMLGGSCRYCRNPIAKKYPIVEAVCGSLFALFYVLLFIAHLGPSNPPLTAPAAWGFGTLTDLPSDWPIYALYMVLVAGLLAASLIDAELFIIPLEIPYFLAIVGIVVHAIIDRPGLTGALRLDDVSASIAAGGAIGLAVSVTLWWLGVMPTSFPEGEPILEVDRAAIEEEIRQAKAAGEALPPVPPPYTRKQIGAEIRKEMLFLLPPMGMALIAAIVLHLPALNGSWQTVLSADWVVGLLGALLGAMVGGFVVWITRILGTLGFGRVAMGLGDVHLMFSVGAILGAGAAATAFFIAPFFGIAVAVYMLFTGKRRELPYGPYLSMASAAMILYYSPIAAYLTPGLLGLVMILRQLLRLLGL